MLTVPRIYLAVLAAAAVALTAAFVYTQRQSSSVAHAAAPAQVATIAGDGFVLDASAQGGAVCLDYALTPAGAHHSSCLLAPGGANPVTTALSRNPATGEMYVYGTTVTGAHAVELHTNQGVQQVATYELPQLTGMRAFAAPPLKAGVLTRVVLLDSAGKPLS